MESLYNYPAVLQSVIAKGQTMYGSRFNVNKDDEPTILKLLYWFLDDELMAAEHGIDLQKGILLSGPIGCGKSAIMRVLNSLCKPDWQFHIAHCERAALQFATEGYQTIEKYSFKAFNRHIPVTICFDDLGIETDIIYFGNTCNTMLHILSIRYDLYTAHDMITHITTNLNSKELEERYGNRLRSRMREMFNVIAFPTNSADKRT